MNNLAMYVGYATGALVAILGFLKALNQVIKMLPITANSLRELFSKKKRCK